MSEEIERLDALLAKYHGLAVAYMASARVKATIDAGIYGGVADEALPAQAVVNMARVEVQLTEALTDALETRGPSGFIVLNPDREP